MLTESKTLEIGRFSSYVSSSLFSTSMGETNSDHLPTSVEDFIATILLYNLNSGSVSFEVFRITGALLISCRYSVAWLPSGVVHERSKKRRVKHVLSVKPGPCVNHRILYLSSVR